METTFVVEMRERQRDISPPDRLRMSDICRISQRLDNSIFDQGCCTIWQGYIANYNNPKKGTYVNFYFRNGKCALHRLLFKNYVGDLSQNQYIRYTCANKGCCLNVNHMRAHTYKKGGSRRNKKVIHSPSHPQPDNPFFLTL